RRRPQGLAPSHMELAARPLRAPPSRLGRRRPTAGWPLPHAAVGERVPAGVRATGGVPAGPTAFARALPGGRVLGTSVAGDRAVLFLVQPSGQVQSLQGEL